MGWSIGFNGDRLAMLGVVLVLVGVLGRCIRPLPQQRVAGLGKQGGGVVARLRPGGILGPVAVRRPQLGLVVLRRRVEEAVVWLVGHGALGPRASSRRSVSGASREATVQASGTSSPVS